MFILIVYFFSRRAASVRSGRRKTTKLKIDVKLPANVRACVPAVLAAAALLQVARHADCNAGGGGAARRVLPPPAEHSLLLQSVRVDVEVE